MRQAGCKRNNKRYGQPPCGTPRWRCIARKAPDHAPPSNNHRKRQDRYHQGSKNFPYGGFPNRSAEPSGHILDESHGHQGPGHLNLRLPPMCQRGGPKGWLVNDGEVEFTNACNCAGRKAKIWRRITLADALNADFGIGQGPAYGHGPTCLAWRAGDRFLRNLRQTQHYVCKFKQCPQAESLVGCWRHMAHVKQLVGCAACCCA